VEENRINLRIYQAEPDASCTKSSLLSVSILPFLDTATILLYTEARVGGEKSKKRKAKHLYITIVRGWFCASASCVSLSLSSSIKVKKLPVGLNASGMMRENRERRFGTDQNSPRPLDY
jgi:hypothetical protein